MKVLVVGGGGREHALCWAIAASPLLTKLWCAPGNAGIAEVAECVPIGAEDIAALVAFARDNAMDVVVAGPEAPLTLGLADACAAAGIRCFGPSAAAARLEASKAFTREVADAAGAPGARWRRFEDAAAARAYVRAQGAPIVVKADGLAAGKGVVVAASVEEAEAAIADIMENRIHGAAGATVLIEECLIGQEVSFFALCDGTTAIPLGAAQDHKRVGEGDTGPNTGGMGAYSPPPVFTDALLEETMARIVRPVLAEMARRGAPFRGVLFAGLMITADGPRLIEFNVRFGDPECQALMVRLRSDLLPALLAACDGELAAFDLRWEPVHSLVVVMAARGYPGPYAKGTEIRGIERAAQVPGVQVFHAGTARREDGALIATGGRVLAVTATGTTLREAQAAAYAAVDAIDWPEGFCRRDIGWRAL
ncbi:phosphoribosylamine--glycine ligase [Roseomonas alkaliterrae]|uniref:Phosphoribosylamine--glycine ligase n=1 Tax=Neoroseomonas alkaliterrae TaxID=1452450 RepID=A0A840Y052_9PROT|nr:phosphoribosylamine--glycine ligase [Neoroseomonas alkaliterrae]MBB5688032.1 phosphoribosylamine--glycine ligase [Neoroseomonas alkaliterrae]MBR0675916.1 phosphoribosylamine--glycine ligase [Neoroseomonas alkaliterrae]